MDSLHGFEPGKVTVPGTRSATSFPSGAEIQHHIDRGQHLRALAIVDSAVAVFQVLMRPLRPLGLAFDRWQSRMHDKQALMQRNDRLLEDIGVRRSEIDSFLKGRAVKKPAIPPSPEKSRLLESLAGRLETVRRGWQAQREIERELGAYRDRELLEIGIRRADIPRIARGLQPMPG